MCAQYGIATEYAVPWTPRLVIQQTSRALGLEVLEVPPHFRWSSFKKYDHPAQQFPYPGLSRSHLSRSRKEVTKVDKGQEFHV